MSPLASAARIAFQDFKNFKGLLLNLSREQKEEINPLPFFLPSSAKAPDFKESVLTEGLFKGRAIELPWFEIIDADVEKFKRFEDYTKVNEVGNIAVWVLAALSYLSPGDLRLGKEIEILQDGNPRDGRLDVAAMRDVSVLMIETKKTLEALLTENRYAVQMKGYHRQGLVDMKQHIHSTDLTLLLGIGGEETDLYPPGHPDCIGGKVGDKAKIFYDKIYAEGIRFISANALWGLVAYKFVLQKDIDIFILLKNSFARADVYGLLSGGLVVHTKNGFVMEPFSLS